MKAQADELKRKAKDYDKVKADIADLEKSITLLKSRIPSEAQVPILLYDIEQMANASQGTLESFQPGELRSFGSGGAGGAPAAQPAAGTMSDILEMPVTIKAGATYPQLIKLMDQRSTCGCRLSIGGLCLAPPPQTGVSSDPTKAISFKNTLSVEFTMSAYVLKTGAEAKQ